MNYIKRKLKTTTGLFTTILGLSILVLGVSYATFVITTNKYKASEMLISNLTYGINITGDSNASINGKTVSVASGKTTTLQVKITSLNDITSNYSLEYKILSGSGKVTYLSSTSYTPLGDINKTGTEKVITVVIEATTDLSIEFNVSGGYTYNGTPSTLTGYTKITDRSHTVTVTSTNTNYGGVTNGSQIVSNNGTATITISPKSGYEYSSNTCSGTVSGNILTIKNITSNKTCTVSFVKSQLTLYAQLLQDNPTILTRTNFNTNIGTNVNTLYKASGNETEDIDGDGIGEEVYYFAGNAQNNWVKFGKDQEDKDLYWRIIRTNEDGGIRLLYVGPLMQASNAFIKLYPFNNNYNYPLYNGYMYGSIGSLESSRYNTYSSSAKNEIDNWYNNTINIKTDTTGNKYDSFVSKTAIYCNDRSGGDWAAQGTSYYAAFTRGGSPTYKCGYNSSGRHYIYNPSKDEFVWNDLSIGLFPDASVADKFSVSRTSGGNGNLQYPISLMTLDEVRFGGGQYSEDVVYDTWFYLNSYASSATGNYRWWLLTPSHYDGSSKNPYIYTVNGSNNNMGGRGQILSVASNNITIAIRPVLSLKSCVKWVKGDGSSTTPYEVSVDSICASAEN